MKSIVSVLQLGGIIEDIVHEAEVEAKSKGEIFNGVADGELIKRINQQIGISWAVKKNSPEFSETDISAVASSRFYHKTGIKLLAFLICVMAGMLALRIVFPFSQYLFMSIVGVASVIILYLYTARLKKERDKLLESIFGKRK